jgi:hypothetical protein
VYFSFLTKRLFGGGPVGLVCPTISYHIHRDTDTSKKEAFQSWARAGIEAGPENVAHVAMKSLALTYFTSRSDPSTSWCITGH